LAGRRGGEALVVKLRLGFARRDLNCERGVVDIDDLFEVLAQ
jgi:hypothetical protein